MCKKPETLKNPTFQLCKKVDKIISDIFPPNKYASYWQLEIKEIIIIYSYFNSGFKGKNMKKIFYIVLVIVALMVISRFVKQGNQTVPSEVITTEEVIPEGVSEDIAVDENGNPIAEEETVSAEEAVSVEEAAEPAEEEIPADAVPAE